MDSARATAAYRLLFECLHRRRDAADLEHNWAEFKKAVAGTPVEYWWDGVIDYLSSDNYALDTRETTPLIEVDWKTTDEDLVWTANRVLKFQGEEPGFEWRFYDPDGAEPMMGFHALNQWLRPRQLCALSFSTGGDYYMVAIVSTEDLPALLAARADMSLEDGASGSVIYEEIPDEWAVDPAEGRPPVYNPEMFRLRWRMRSRQHDGPWSVDFDDPAYAAVGEEATIRQLLDTYRRNHPDDREVEPVKVELLLVVEGAPETWFVVHEESPDLRRKREVAGSGPFLTSGAGLAYGLTEHVEFALARRSFASASQGLHDNQRVITVEAARVLAAEMGLAPPSLALTQEVLRRYERPYLRRRSPRSSTWAPRTASTAGTASKDPVKPPQLKPGDRVVHAKFGAGSVVSLAGEGHAASAVVNFDVAGEKELVLLWANLERG